MTDSNQTPEQDPMPNSGAEPLDPIEAARQYGIDIEALKANLARPVEERLRRHQNALNLFRRLHNRGRP